MRQESESDYIERVFDMAWQPTPAFEEVREIVKRSKPEDVRVILAWLVQHFDDDGRIGSLHFERRRIVIDGTQYWLVRRD